MTVYTVHQPRPRKGETTADPDRFVFVRDGFYFWAFLLGPLWMLWHRLWLVLVLYVAGTTALQVGLWRLGVSDGIKFAIGVLIALLVGFEAASLRRWTLGRRRWNNVGLVVAPDLESAERRFFDSWVARRSPPPAAPVPPSPPRIPPSTPDVVGLFPQPETRR
jgi:Protein of unknown function (DUF2628)